MADSARHPDVVDLAEYAEGLLEPDRQRSVEEHVRDCADCSGVLSELAGVPETLAQAPIPLMPADVAARIDRAIAAESTARASTWSGSAARVTPARRPRRWLAPLASAAAVVAALAIAVPALNSSDSASDDASGGADTASEPADSRGHADAPLFQAEPEPVALTSDNFGREVIDAYYSGGDAVRVEALVPTVGPGVKTYRETVGLSGVCKSDGESSVPHGAIDPITLDGQPAQLLRRDHGRAIDVVAFVCDDDRAQVLETTTLIRR